MVEEGKVTIFVTHGPESPERNATPFYMASVALAMDCEAEMIFQINGVLLLKKGVAEKAKAKEGGKLLQYEFDNSKLSRLGAKADQLPEQVVNMRAEGAKLGRYELSNSPLRKAPGKVTDMVSQATEMISEGLGLARYEATKKKR